ncbi:MAG: TGS domain-containing protein, partial [Tardiphaga sp.]
MPDNALPPSGFQFGLANLTPANQITVTFPDGAAREFAPGITGFEIAKGISPSLAKRTVAMALDGVVTDLSDAIEKDAKIDF